MKTVLILVLSSDFPPYSTMINTSQQTWDSIQMPGTETIFYCSQKDNPEKQNTDKILYFNVGNSLFDMGWKNLAMFEWALQNKQFDYVARVNASCYVDKKALLKYVQDLPIENVFAGVEIKAGEQGYKENWLWGGGMFLISKDVFQKIVANKNEWRHDLMEDVAMSFLVNKLQIPFTEGNSCSIDKMPDGWRLISYGTNKESISFTDFADVKRLNHFFYRVKQDQKRYLDEYIMRELFKVLE